jgi:hypothetical protein
VQSTGTEPAGATDHCEFDFDVSPVERSDGVFPANSIRATVSEQSFIAHCAEQSFL